MSWLLRDNWIGSLLAFVLGAAITWFLLDRHRPTPAVSPGPAQNPAAEEPQLRQPAPQAPTTRTPQPAPAEPAGAGTTPAQPAPAEPPGAGTAPAEPAAAEPARAEPAPAGQPARSDAPAPAAPPVAAARLEFSQLMDAEPTLFDEIQPAPHPASDESPEVPPGRYGEGSADAVPHQGPPDGFTIKGNAQSMLFHTPDSPYYGRTKPEVWFRTEADAERAGFTKYTRRPRKATNPRD